MEKLIILKESNFLDIFGSGDEYLKLIEKSLNVRIFARGDKVKISGNKKNALTAYDTIFEMIETISKTKNLSKNDVQKIIALAQNEFLEESINSNEVIVKGKNGEVKAKTVGQQNYIEKVSSLHC